MKDFVFHAVPGSPFARSAYAALIEKGTSFRITPLAPGASKQPAHMERHAFGRIPVLDHGDFRLYETAAILRYIDRVLPTPPLTPADPQMAARMDQVMSINDWYLFNGVNNVIGFQRIVKPRLLGMPADEAAVAAALPKAHAVINELSRLLGRHDYFAGANVSLADLLVMPQLDFLAATPEWAILSASVPNIVAWLGRMNERPSMQATTWEKVAALANAA